MMLIYFQLGCLHFLAETSGRVIWGEFVWGLNKERKEAEMKDKVKSEREHWGSPGVKQKGERAALLLTLHRRECGTHVVSNTEVL